MLQFIVIALIRILVPLAIFRWRFWGGILAILADISDAMIMEAFGFGPFQGQTYHNADKLFDIYYLFIEFLIVLKWTNVLARRTGIFLFVWRFIGFAVYEITGLRYVFLLAPNIFEFFYLAVEGLKKYFPRFKLDNIKKLAIILVIIGVPNIIKEYYMHYLESETWIFFRDHLFWWLYK